MEACDLKNGKCKPCEGGIPSLSQAEAQKLMKGLEGWVLKDEHLFKEYTLEDFVAIMVLVNQVADLAEEEGHHPDLNIHGWNSLTITLFTHAIDGLSENDFIVAAKIDALEE